MEKSIQSQDCSFAFFDHLVTLFDRYGDAQRGGERRPNFARRFHLILELSPNPKFIPRRFALKVLLYEAEIV